MLKIYYKNNEDNVKIIQYKMLNNFHDFINKLDITVKVGIIYKL